MELFLLGALLTTAAAFAAFELFDGGDDRDDEEEQPGAAPLPVVNGTEGDDLFSQPAEAQSDVDYRGGDGHDNISVHGHSRADGEGGDDQLTGREFSTIRGGEGNDELSTWESATAHGGAGEDTLEAYDTSDADGGAGNDFLFGYHQSTIRGGDGDDTLIGNEAYGGQGDDAIFVWGAAYGGEGIDTFFVRTYGSVSESSDTIPGADEVPEIMDYQRGTDRIAVYTPTHPADIRILSDGTDSYVEVTGTDARYMTRFVVRGVADLTEADLSFTPSRYDNYDAEDVMQWQGGTPGDDTIALTGAPTALFTGEGDDSVTAPDGGPISVDLGAGDDTFVGGNTAAWVYGGAGEDHITVQAPPAGTYVDEAPDDDRSVGPGTSNYVNVDVDGGAGNDVIHVTRGDEHSSDTPKLNVHGGDGDDLLSSDGIGLTLYGGAGADTLTGGSGTIYDVKGFPEESDLIRVTFGEDAFTTPVTTHIIIDPLNTDDPAQMDRIELTIDSVLTGDLTWEFQSEYDYEQGGHMPAYTIIRIGGLQVATISDGVNTAIDPLTDPRITIIRPAA